MSLLDTLNNIIKTRAKKKIEDVKKTAKQILELSKKTSATETAQKIQSVIKNIPLSQALASPKTAILQAVSKPVGELAKSVAQAVPRAIASVGIESAAGVVSLIKGKTVKPEYQPTGVLKTLLGEAPIKGIMQRTEETQKVAKEFLEKRGQTGKNAQALSMFAAPLFIAGTTAADLLPLEGGGKVAITKAAPVIAKLDDVGKIFNLLKPILKGKTDDAIRFVAENLAKITDEKAVVKYIDDALKTTKEVPTLAISKESELLTQKSKKTAEIFEGSKNQTLISKREGINFELGSFGRNHQIRKVAEKKFDRFVEAELPETIQNIKQSFRASNDPKNYRLDNIVHIAEMPNGETRAIYTRLNKNGAEEIINWHLVPDTKKDKFLNTLSSFGIPSRTRTGIFGLEDQQSIRLAYGDNIIIPPSKESVKAQQKYSKISDEIKGVSPAGIVDEVAKVKPEKAGNIRLDKLNTSEDAAKFIKDIAEQNKTVIDEQRRNVITMEAAQKLADNLGMTREQLAKTRAGKAFNAEELIASNELLKFSAEDVTRLRKEIEAGDNSDTALIKFRQALLRHAEVQKAASGVRAEAGRALGALRYTARDIPTEQKALKEMMDALGGREMTEKIIERFSKIDPNDVLAVNKFIRDTAKVKKTEQIYWIWLNSILSNPMTHIVNNTSNLARALLEIPIKGVQATAELVKGKNREVFFGEIPYQVWGSVEGISEGVRKALFVLKEGMSPAMVSKLEMGSKNVQPIKGLAGAILGMPTRALGAEDEFFKAMNGTAELAALAYRKATKEGLKGANKVKRIAELKMNSTTEMLEDVSKLKLETTFQEELGSIGKWIIKGRDKVPGLKYIIPFIKTPTNIVKEALRISPLGFADALRKSGVERTRAIAKATIGSAIASAVVIETMKGNITGQAPKNKSERDAFYREGKQPYAIKIGDTWYSYRRLEPFATVIGLTADAVNIIKDGGDIKDLANKSVSLIANNLNDKTFMAGISNALNAINDPQRYGSDWIQQTISGFIPGAVNYVTKLQDEVIRNPKGLKEKIMSRIPFLSERIPPKRNVWGEKIKTEGGALYRAIIPTQKGEVKEDATDQELKKLGIIVNFPSDKLTIPSEIAKKLEISDEKRSITLTNEEYDKYTQLRGKVLKKVLDSIISNPSFQQADDATKEELITEVINKVNAESKETMLPFILKTR